MSKMFTFADQLEKNTHTHTNYKPTFFKGLILNVLNSHNLGRCGFFCRYGRNKLQKHFIDLFSVY